jgi:hypothetical protein
VGPVTKCGVAGVRLQALLDGRDALLVPEDRGEADIDEHQTTMRTVFERLLAEGRRAGARDVPRGLLRHPAALPTGIGGPARTGVRTRPGGSGTGEQLKLPRTYRPIVTLGAGEPTWRLGVLAGRPWCTGMSMRDRLVTAAVVMDGVPVVSWRSLPHREKPGL